MASGENLKSQKQAKLYHSRSDDRRRSLDRFHGDSQSSRHSLNANIVVEGCSPEYELKYFTTTSLDMEESKADILERSRMNDFEDQEGTNASPDAISKANTLLEEPELENFTEEEVEGFTDLGIEISVTQLVDEKERRKENMRNLEEAADEIEVYADDNESESSTKDDALKIGDD